MVSLRKPPPESCSRGLSSRIWGGPAYYNVPVQGPRKRASGSAGTGRGEKAQDEEEEEAREGAAAGGQEEEVRGSRRLEDKQ